MAHIQRYIRASIENEADKTWNKDMLQWITKAVKYWNLIDKGEKEYDEQEAEKFIEEFNRILEKAKKEYEYVPPTEYYRDGYNTFLRMYEDRESYILFLRNPAVPPTNNMAERSGRRYKRKNAQVMSFRSAKGAEYFCNGLSIRESIKAKEENLFNGLTDRFNS